MSSFAFVTSRPSAHFNSLARRVVVVLAASLVVAATARVAFPLPFTPVPFTLQPLAVLAVGLLLGPVDGTLALLAYLTEGAVGLPVFSPTGPGGLLQLFGPTGGYLMADPLVACIAGLTARRLAPHVSLYWAATIAGALATGVLFLAGSVWLGYLHPTSVHGLWMAAIAPFLPGEMVKVLVAAGLFKTLHTNAAQ